MQPRLGATQGVGGASAQVCHSRLAGSLRSVPTGRALRSLAEIFATVNFAPECVGLF